MTEIIIVILCICLALLAFLWYQFVKPEEDDLEGADYCESGYQDDTKETKC